MALVCNLLKKYVFGCNVLRKPQSCYEKRRSLFISILKCHSQNLSTDSAIPRNTHRNLQTLRHLWTDRLSRAGVSEAECSVNLIVAHAFGKKMIHDVDMKIEPDNLTLKIIEDMLNERLKRVPVQYIIGEWDFHDMTLEMREPVLIPRAETEELADMIIDQWPLSRDQTARFLEIGCGTGAISLYILRLCPKVTCTAVDKNETACELTMRNALRYNLQDRLHVIHGDICTEETLSQMSREGPYDVVVSNPPYLTADEMESLETEVADHEDHDALYGGRDGLDLVRKILEESLKLLKDKQSALWLEVGLGHPEKIRRIVEMHTDYLLSYTETFKDFTGRDRFCKLQLKN